jgi:hypothetical protein
MKKVGEPNWNLTEGQEIYCGDCGGKMFPDLDQEPVLGADTLVVIPILCSNCKAGGSVLLDFDVSSFPR